VGGAILAFIVSRPDFLAGSPPSFWVSYPYYVWGLNMAEWTTEQSISGFILSTDSLTAFWLKWRSAFFLSSVMA
jgi:hypothetical protein